MKSRWFLLLAVAVLLNVGGADSAQAGLWSTVSRYLGWGWSDGYHAGNHTTGPAWSSSPHAHHGHYPYYVVPMPQMTPSVPLAPRPTPAPLPEPEALPTLFRLPPA